MFRIRGYWKGRRGGGCSSRPVLPLFPARPLGQGKEGCLQGKRRGGFSPGTSFPPSREGKKVQKRGGEPLIPHVRHLAGEKKGKEREKIIRGGGGEKARLVLMFVFFVRRGRLEKGWGSDGSSPLAQTLGGGGFQKKEEGGGAAGLAAIFKLLHWQERGNSTKGGGREKKRTPISQKSLLLTISQRSRSKGKRKKKILGGFFASRRLPFL